MESEFSKSKFFTFLDVAGMKGLVNPNTANGWRAAGKIFADEPDTADVRSIDIKTAIRRYNNGHPGILSPASLAAYEKRLGIAIEEFTKFQKDPAAYKGRGRHPTTASASATKKADIKITPGTGGAKFQAGPATVDATVLVTPGLSLEFPMRSEFLAQVVVPRDMTHAEAVRFTRFIMALAQDPVGGTTGSS
jgi:hypothetical protein